MMDFLNEDFLSKLYLLIVMLVISVIKMILRSKLVKMLIAAAILFFIISLCFNEKEQSTHEPLSDAAPNIWTYSVFSTENQS